MLSRKAKHLALAANNFTSSWARFFATLRYAQNDGLLYFFANTGITMIPTIILVSLSYLLIPPQADLRYLLLKKRKLNAKINYK